MMMKKQIMLIYSVGRQPVGILANCGPLTSEAALKVRKPLHLLFKEIVMIYNYPGIHILENECSDQNVIKY